MHYYLNVWRKYGAFNGRASRPEYWQTYLINVLITMILYLISGLIWGWSYWVVIGGVSVHMTQPHAYLIDLYALAFLLPNLGVTVRRLHDTGHSAWALLWGFLPVIGWILLIVYLAKKSRPVNDYGPRPQEAR